MYYLKEIASAYCISEYSFSAILENTLLAASYLSLEISLGFCKCKYTYLLQYRHHIPEYRVKKNVCGLYES